MGANLKLDEVCVLLVVELRPGVLEHGEEHGPLHLTLRQEVVHLLSLNENYFRFYVNSYVSLVSKMTRLGVFREHVDQI